MSDDLYDIPNINTPNPPRCICEPGEDGRTWVRDGEEHGERAIKARLLPVGTLVRRVRSPHLTGKIEGLEWTDRERLSPIPYRIAWDDNRSAAETLGWLFLYACVEDVEAAEKPDLCARAVAEREAMRRAYAEGRGVSPAELVQATEEALNDG